MHAPVARPRTHVTNEDASRVLDAANAAYGLMLRCLAQAYETPWSQAGSHSRLLGACMSGMKLVSILGKALTRLQAASDPEVKAGMSFAMMRAVEGPQRPADAVGAFTERAADLAAALAVLPLPKATTEEALQLLDGFATAL